MNSIFRLCGVTLLRREKPAWFPVEELRDDNNVTPHKITGVERMLLGWREDGQEGVCCQSEFTEDVEENSDQV